ncbi:MAG: RecQ family ATP-dependent DNA helicase [Candidatus Gracilibacteria bacterium]|nr:RecQ family ATP-dependent DNA helicase [Candidatus Gracilibacteria bacterium]
MQNLEQLLQNKFGLESFREGQLEIIESVIKQNDTLVFMPTGGGKSLTYQFPGVYLPGLAIIISPLISLMKDQVDKLNSLGLRAELINSTISTMDKEFILDEIAQNDSESKGRIKFLYIATERLNDSYFLSVIKNIDISLIAIDEAHCISQWGHDFRPSYLKIKGFIDTLRKVKHFPILALTATATKKVREDIVERLGLTKYNIFTKGFDRKNLIFVVREISKTAEKLEKLLEIIEKTPPYGIVYCSSIKAVTEVYNFLLLNGVNVGKYTGEMNAGFRESEQNNFMDSSYDVIVATNAFGMGIDKKDIRYVVHYNLPGSIENFYQEAGRAGRDGKKSYSIVIASYQDSIIQEFFIDNAYPPEDDIFKVYDYLYDGFKIGEGSGHQILKTYKLIARETGLKNDMKVGSIIKILEKYNIVKRGFDGDSQESDNFRGRGITLVLAKKTHKEVPILWHHQNLLKEEGYFKLEQIKKLLFKPGCRKKFILTYFGDEEDLKNLGENCGACDYCLDKNKFQAGEVEEIIHYTTFLIILEFIKRFDNKFGLNTLIGVLVGAKEKKILEWNLDTDKDYSVLSELNKDVVSAIFEALLELGFLYRSFGQYPKIGITEKGLNTIYHNDLLLDENDSMQAMLYGKISKYKNAIKSGKPKREKVIKIPVEKIDTYSQTLTLLKMEKTIKEIAEERGFGTQTIEDHIVKLYNFDKLSLAEIMKFSDFSKLKKVKEIIEKNKLDITKLSPIKELCPPDIAYFDIKISLAMMDKKDL